MTELLIHSHLEDMLPDDHPWAFAAIYCPRCDKMLHAGNNECMSTWVEFDGKVLCLMCLVESAGTSGLENLDCIGYPEIEEWFRLPGKIHKGPDQCR